MSNHEGNAWNPRDGREDEGFARPSDIPPRDEPTAQAPTVDPPYEDYVRPDSSPGGQSARDPWGSSGDTFSRYETPEASEQPKKSRFGWMRWLAVVVVSALIGALAGGLAGGSTDASNPIRSESTIGQASEASNQEATPSNIRGVLDRVQPAVVTIETVSPAGKGSGTGMIVSSDGEVLTNNHVVANARQILVTLDNETEPRTARLLGGDPTIDSALLKIDGVSNLPTVEFADSTAVQVGDAVVAIGNALALTGGPSVTSGIVSAKDRSITDETSSLSNLIQTDTAINPGNSGGPLVNMAGQVIAMNTAVIRGSSGEFENIGFGIAMNTVQPAIADLRQGIANQPAYLGLNPVTLDPSIKARFELTPERGAVVSQVEPGSPADLAGLSRFDVITEVDGTEIATSDALVTLIRSKKPGDAVRIVFFRGEERNEVTANLIARPES